MGSSAITQEAQIFRALADPRHDLREARIMKWKIDRMRRKEKKFFASIHEALMHFEVKIYVTPSIETDGLRVLVKDCTFPAEHPRWLSGYCPIPPFELMVTDEELPLKSAFEKRYEYIKTNLGRWIEDTLKYLYYGEHEEIEKLRMRRRDLKREGKEKFGIDIDERRDNKT